jgi:hypothetical protein
MNCPKFNVTLIMFLDAVSVVFGGLLLMMDAEPI